jgi:hypothetical protein
MNNAKLLHFLILLLAGLANLAGSTAHAQNSRFERMREWTAAGSSRTLEAKMIAVDADSVTLESSNGKQASIPINSLSDADQALIAEYKDSLFNRLKRQTREALFAREALKLFQEFKDAGLINDSNREFVESKLEILEEEAHVNSIFFGNRFITLDQLASKKANTKLTVDEWLAHAIETNSGADQKALRDATKVDPTSLEAAMLAALHHEIHEANFETSGRLLEDAIKRGQRYLPVANEFEKYNLLAALNNLAVSSVRENKITRALKLWEQADEFSELDLPEPLKFNIAKVDRMINDEQSGLKADRAVQTALGRFADTLGARGESGGWKVMLPKDIEGNYRHQIDFVILNSEAQVLSDQEIQDSRCVRCTGSTKLRCPANGCQSGGIDIPVIGERTMTLPDGSIQNLGRGRIGTERVKCNTCNGEGVVRCPYCDRGMQKN